MTKRAKGHFESSDSLRPILKDFEAAPFITPKEWKRIFKQDTKNLKAQKP